MPSTAMPAAILSVSSTSCGCCSPSSQARLADVVGEQQLAAGRRPQPVDVLVGALVGDREAADLLDVVAPELHPQRVLLGGREDVDDAAADRELAAPLDQVDPGVRRVGEPLHDVLQRRGLAGHQLDGLEVAEPLDLRLQHRADRGDDDLERAVGGVVARVGQPAQHREPAADGVAARAEPLVRQRLPARVERHRVGVEQRAERLDQVLGLARGRGDGEHRAPGADQPVDHERPHAGRTGEVEGAHGAAAGVGDRLVEGGVGEDGVGEAGEGHESSWIGWGTAREPPTRERVGVRLPSLRAAADRPSS